MNPKLIIAKVLLWLIRILFVLAMFFMMTIQIISEYRLRFEISNNAIRYFSGRALLVIVLTVLATFIVTVLSYIYTRMFFIDKPNKFKTVFKREAFFFLLFGVLAFVYDVFKALYGINVI